MCDILGYIASTQEDFFKKKRQATANINQVKLEKCWNKSKVKYKEWTNEKRKWETRNEKVV